MNECDCESGLYLKTIVHLDDGDVFVSITACGVDDYQPVHQECTLAVNRAVQENLVAMYRGNQ